MQKVVALIRFILFFVGMFFMLVNSILIRTMSRFKVCSPKCARKNFAKGDDRSLGAKGGTGDKNCALTVAVTLTVSQTSNTVGLEWHIMLCWNSLHDYYKILPM